MGFGKWLRRKIDESDEKQRGKAKKRKYFEHLGKISRGKQTARLEEKKEFKRIELEKQERMIDPFGLERSVRASGRHWKRVMSSKPYGTKRKKRLEEKAKESKRIRAREGWKRRKRREKALLDAE